MTAQPLEPIGTDAAYEHSVAAHRAIKIWLAMPASERTTKELDTLQEHLQILPALRVDDNQRASTLQGLKERTVAALERVIFSLGSISLPIPRKSRQVARRAQDVARLLADQMVSQLTDVASHTEWSTERTLNTLQSVLELLERHLLLSYLTAATATGGIWRTVHEAYRLALVTQGSDARDATALTNARNRYKQILLMGCTQPASLTASELLFARAVIDRVGDHADLIASPQETDTVFWIDASRDAGAQAPPRRTLSGTDTTLFALSAAPIVTRLAAAIAALEGGTPAGALDLPDAAGTPLGLAILKRLKNSWEKPAKRRFPRRKQNYRVVLCSGLEDLWHLFGDHRQHSIETSGWMITNESPDGYAVMHVMGKLGDAIVGDIVAIRNETGKTWQVCLIRWAQSENQEHLELGLQILSSKAVPAALIQTGDEESTAARHVVLLLPPIPPLRAREVLIAAAGWIRPNREKMVLLVDQERIEIREIHRVESEYNELSERIEMFAIEPDPD